MATEEEVPVPAQGSGQDESTQANGTSESNDTTESSGDVVTGNADGAGGQIVDAIMNKVSDASDGAGEALIPVADKDDFVWPDEKSVFNPLCSDGIPEVPEAGDTVYKSIFTEI